MKIASLSAMVVCLLFPLTIAAANAQHLSVNARLISTAEQSSETGNLTVKNREQAIQLVKHQYQGKVLKAQSVRINGHSGYKIKLLSNEGVVFYLFVDAHTGSVSRN